MEYLAVISFVVMVSMAVAIVRREDVIISLKEQIDELIEALEWERKR